MQRQFGHASIQLTVDTYGKWLPMGNKAAVNRLTRSFRRHSGLHDPRRGKGFAISQ